MVRTKNALKIKVGGLFAVFCMAMLLSMGYALTFPNSSVAEEASPGATFVEDGVIGLDDTLTYEGENCSLLVTVSGDATWGQLTAIADGHYYETPQGPYNWMGFPPSVQRYLGMMWMAKLLYPDAADYDLYEEVARYYDLFYHCDLTRDQYDALVANSIGRQAAQ